MVAGNPARFVKHLAPSDPNEIKEAEVARIEVAASRAGVSG